VSRPRTHRGYYLIIDRLFEILDQRIRKWHGPKRQREGSSRMGRLFSSLSGSKQSGGEGSIDKDGVDGKASLEEKLDVGKSQLYIYYMARLPIVLRCCSRCITNTFLLSRAHSPSYFGGGNVPTRAFDHLSGLEATEYRLRRARRW
jgi:hypothetical protein